MAFNLAVILGLISIFLKLYLCEPLPYDLKVLIPGKVYNSTKTNEKLQIYCYKGIKKHLFHVWQTSFFTLDLDPSDYNLYRGLSPKEVFSMYEADKSSWANKIFSWKSNRIDVDPFNLNCIGIDTELDHSVKVNVIRVDFWRIVCLAIGIVIFLTAPKLSSNPVFYYLCGIILGIATSLLLAVYFLSKFIPKKTTVYAFFITGWAVAVYLFQLVLENLKIILTNHFTYVLYYMTVTGLISFIVCYRFGPITDPRSKNLIKWAMQIFSLCLIFYSSRCQEASLIFTILLLLYYNLSKNWFYSFLTIWRNKFPPKKEFLTEDEYHEQGVKETIKALEDLKKYCSSPECNQWKTVLALRKPTRFAEFMEGNSHLEDSEILAYESESQKSLSQLTDDSDTTEDE